MNIDLLILKAKSSIEKKKNPDNDLKYYPHTKKLNAYLSLMRMIKEEPEKFKHEYIDNIEEKSGELFPELIRLLSKNKVDFDYFKTTPILFKVNSVLCLNALLKAGADINIQKNGQNALFFLRDEAVKFLINKGLDVNIKDDKGNNALAVNKEFLSRKVLVENGIDIDNVNHDNENVLFHLILPISELELYKNKVNFHLINNKGESFLFPLFSLYAPITYGYAMGESAMTDWLNENQEELNLNYHKVNNVGENLYFFIRNTNLLKFLVGKSLSLFQESDEKKILANDHIKNLFPMDQDLKKDFSELYIRQEKDFITALVTPSVKPGQNRQRI